MSFCLRVIPRLALNGECGNSRDASVHADAAKSRFPKWVALALRRRNSSRTATEVWRAAWPRYYLRDRTAHPTQKQEAGETAFLTSPSQFPPDLISWRDEILAVFTSHALPLAGIPDSIRDLFTETATDSNHGCSRGSDFLLLTSYL